MIDQWKIRMHVANPDYGNKSCCIGLPYTKNSNIFPLDEFYQIDDNVQF